MKPPSLPCCSAVRSLISTSYLRTGRTRHRANRRQRGPLVSPPVFITLLCASLLACARRVLGSPPTTQPATVAARSASEQSPAPADHPTALPTPPRPTPSSFDAFANDLWDRETLTGDWRGGREDIEAHGLTPEVSLLQAASENFTGGIRTNRIDWRYRLDVGLTLDTHKLFGWKGGTAFVDFMAHGGQNPPTNLVGQLQAISAIDQSPATRLDQLWYRQDVLQGHLWFKLGRIDTTYDFDNIRDAQPFLNGSFGFTPTIFVFPSFPFSAWGGEACWKPIKQLKLQAGLFDGNTENTLPAVANTNPYAVENPYGILSIGEESVNWRLAPRHLSGTVSLGEWYHTGSFQTYTGTSVQGAHGFYVYLDQTLWKVAHAQGHAASRIGAFIQYGWANGQLTEIDRNLLGGLRWRGPIPRRPDDNLGIGTTWAHLSRYAGTNHNFELIVEGFYSLELTPWLNVQPDLQYVINPSGKYPNALVATVQAGLQF